MRTVGFTTALVLLGGCGDKSQEQAAVAGASLRNVSPAQADSLIRADQGDPDFVLLDIRTPQEFAGEHLAGATILDFYAPTFKQDLAKLDKDKSYLIYCRTGHRSGIALGTMGELGFKDAANMLGGITRWKSEGLPTTK